jgi:hypothetical protein
MGEEEIILIPKQMKNKKDKKAKRINGPEDHRHSNYQLDDLVS